MLSMMLVALAQPPLAAPDCPIDRAVYRLKGDGAYSAGFARQDRRKAYASDLVLWLRTPKRTYWFSFGSPNGYGGTYISPDIDPRLASRMDDDEERDAMEQLDRSEDTVSLEFDAFASDLSIYPNPPQADSPAPALLFARRLGSALWYNPTGLAGGDASATQESMPIGLFEAAGCEGPPKVQEPPAER